MMMSLKKGKNKSQQGRTAGKAPEIPLGAVPHLFNAQILQWHKTNYEALKAIHDVLIEILAAIKED
jgi:hypothetical protein